MVCIGFGVLERFEDVVNEMSNGCTFWATLGVAQFDPISLQVVKPNVLFLYLI